MIPSDQIKADLEEIGGALVAARFALIEDISSSYLLAMKNAGVLPELIAEVNTAVEDYIANHYGED